MLEKFKPIIHVPREEPDCQLIDVLFELRPRYIILWYHWPNDDYTGKPDYEPVILFLKANQLVAIGIRPHTKYKHALRWVTEGSRPVIIFTTAWHGPMINHGRIRDAFAASFSLSAIADKIDDYSLISGIPPPWYITDDANVSVYDYADRMARELGIP